MNGDDKIYGGKGKDYIKGGGGKDIMHGGANSDTFLLSRGKDIIKDFNIGEIILVEQDMIGSELKYLDIRGNLLIKTNKGVKTIIENINTKVFLASGGIQIIPVPILELESKNFSPPKSKKTINGTNKNDKIKGTKKNDLIIGKKGDDTLYGRKNNDKIFGMNGDDKIYGGKGKDYIKGGGGKDIMFGGEKADTFSLSLGRDKIKDFKIGETILIKQDLIGSELKYLDISGNLLIKTGKGIHTTLNNINTDDFLAGGEAQII